MSTSYSVSLQFTQYVLLCRLFTISVVILRPGIGVLRARFGHVIRQRHDYVSILIPLFLFVQTSCLGPIRESSGPPHTPNNHGVLLVTRYTHTRENEKNGTSYTRTRHTHTQKVYINTSSQNSQSTQIKTHEIFEEVVLKGFGYETKDCE